MQTYCSHCGTSLKGKTICKKCGFKEGQGNSYCPFCGFKLPYGEIYSCPHCFKILKKGKSFQAKLEIRSMLVAGFLQIFFGIFALGRIYLKDYKIAFLQIITAFLTLGLGLLWPFIDGLMILNGKFKYNKNKIIIKEYGEI